MPKRASPDHPEISSLHAESDPGLYHVCPDSDCAVRYRTYDRTSFSVTAPGLASKLSLSQFSDPEIFSNARSWRLYRRSSCSPWRTQGDRALVRTGNTRGPGSCVACRRRYLQRLERLPGCSLDRPAGRTLWPGQQTARAGRRNRGVWQPGAPLQRFNRRRVAEGRGCGQ